MLGSVLQCAHCAVEIARSEAKFDTWHGGYYCSLRCIRLAQEEADYYRTEGEQLW